MWSTRWARAYAENGALRDPKVARVLEEFLRARKWDDTKSLLERNRNVLLSNLVIASLRQRVRYRREHPSESDLSADQLEMHLVFLEDSRQLGISAAWGLLLDRRNQALLREAQPPRPDPVDNDGADAQLKLFIEGKSTIATLAASVAVPHSSNEELFPALMGAILIADTPAVAYHILRTNAERYLKWPFVSYLEKRISEFKASHNDEVANVLMRWNALITDACDRGVDVAFEAHQRNLDFTGIALGIRQNLEWLVSSDSQDEAHDILSGNKLTFLSATAVQSLANAALYYHTIGDDQLAEASEALRYLLTEMAQSAADDVPLDVSARLNAISVFRPFIPPEIPQEYARAIKAMDGLPAQQQEQLLSSMLQKLNSTDDRLISAILYLHRGRVRSEKEVTLSQYQERALADFSTALEVLTPDRWPICWATTLYRRAEIMTQRLSGDRSQNLTSALNDLQSALTRICPDILPRTWAYIHRLMGRNLMEPSSTRHVEDNERALEEFDIALTVYSRSFYPNDWAHITMMKANAYRHRVLGNHADNVEQTLTHLNAVLTVWTRENAPEDWSMAVHNRALAYRDRTRGSRAENLEHALADFTAALTVRTQKDMPIHWAETHASRGGVYTSRILGDRAINLDLALQDLDTSLKVRTRDEMPHLWAETMFFRAAAHFNLVFVSDHPHDELQMCLDDIDACLEIYTETSAPELYWNAQHVRAQALELLVDKQKAHEAYASLRVQTRAMSNALLTERGRLGVLGKAADADIYVRDATLMLTEANPDVKSALLILEEGRAQRLRSALSLDVIARAPEIEPSFREHMENRGRAAYPRSEGQHYRSQPPLETTTDMKLADDALEARRQKSESDYETYQRAVYGVVESNSDKGEYASATLQYLVQAVADPGSAIVYLFADKRGGHALVVSQNGDQTLRADDLPLPFLTDDAVSSLLLTKAERQIPSVSGAHSAVLATGGLVAAQMRLGRSILPAWGLSLRDAVAELPSDCGFRIAGQLLLDTWVTSPDQHMLTTRSFVSLGDQERSVIMDVFESTVLNLELRRCLSMLGKLGLDTLAEYLARHNLSSISLIPFGRLGLLPVSSAQINVDGDLMFFCDRFETKLAPNGLSVLGSQIRAANSDQNHGQFLTLGNPKPQPSHVRDLPSAEAESRAAYDIAIAKGLPRDQVLRLAPEEGNKAHVIEGLQRAWLAHLAVHGTFLAEDPLNSYLLLSGDDSTPEADCHLSLHEAIQGKVNMAGLRLLVLSACETAINDVLDVPDEVLSLAAGFIQAGAAGVIASLWAVDDHASYLLITRFFQFYLDQRTPCSPGQALVKAQRWLREEATNELLSKFDPLVAAYDEEAGDQIQRQSYQHRNITSMSRTAPVLSTSLRTADGNSSSQPLANIRANAALWAEDDPAGLPYSEPIFWAGFTITGC